MDDQALTDLLTHADGLLRQGQAAKVRDLLIPVAAQKPEQAQVYYLLGLASFDLNNKPDALNYFQQAITLSPKNAVYYNTFGVTLNALGYAEQAVESYRQAIILDPQSAGAYYNMGNALGKLQRYDEAVQAYSKNLALKKDNVSAYSNLGNVLLTLKRHSEAILCLRTALMIDPQSATSLSNLGNVFLDLKQIKTGMHYLRRAYAIDPAVENLPSNIALGLIAERRQEEAIAFLDQFLARYSNDDRLRMIRAHARLHMGQYAEGWDDYEARITAKDKLPRNEPGRRWKGESFVGKRLIIISEQGLGDTIWIARYLSRVKQLGGTVIMECLPQVIPLIAAMGIVDDIIPRQENLPDADLFVYQCSLPALFSPSAASIPNAPYIRPETPRRAKFEPLLAQGKGKLRIGIIWSGNTLFPGNPDRAAPLTRFLQALTLPNVQLYSLQKGAPAADLKTLPPGASILDLAPLIDDFADTAAAIDGLDLVIMTDTSTAHLVGAMGKPVWVLLNYVSSWLWRRDGETTPWYPSMRLFRPTVWHDWRGVFDQVSVALMDLIQNQTGKS